MTQNITLWGDWCFKFLCDIDFRFVDVFLFPYRTYLVVPELSKELDVWTARQGKFVWQKVYVKFLMSFKFLLEHSPIFYCL